MEVEQFPSTRQLLKSKPHAKAVYSSFFTLTLAIMGGAILLPSAAFATTGIVAGFFGLTIVALANAFTCDMLLWQTYKTGQSDYETLAFAIGGWPWRLLTEFSIVILMGGTMMGSTIQVGQTFASGLSAIMTNPPPPGWAIDPDGSGRVLMVIFTIGLIFPLSLMKTLTALDIVGVVGFGLVLFLAFWIMIKACIAGLPYLGSSGEFSAVGFSPFGNWAQAVSTFGYCFYIQPVMMPMLMEMPAPGLWGMKSLSWGTRGTVLGSSYLVYVLIGFFGAAWFGADTNGNILVNTLGPIGIQAFLNFSIGLYIALAMPPLYWPFREVLDSWFRQIARLTKQPWLYPKSDYLRHVLLHILITAIVLGLAVALPTNSAKVLTITGASGVLMVSYVIPILNHWILYFGMAKCQRQASEFSSKSDFWTTNGSTSATNGKNPAADESYPPPAKPGLRLDGKPLDDNMHFGYVHEVETMMSPDAVILTRKESARAYRRDYGPGIFGAVQAFVNDFAIPAIVLMIGFFASITTFYYV